MPGDLGGGKGRVISCSNRRQIISLIDEYIANGGKRINCCKILGINQSTYFRWKSELKKTGQTSDARFTAKHQEPVNKLSIAERTEILNLLDSPEFVDLTPHEIFYILADRGIYLASIRSFYRILKQNHQIAHRIRSKKPQKRTPLTHVATAPNQVWSWYITYLEGPVKGQYFYLYMIIDIFSRYITGWEIWEEQTGEHAKSLITKASLAENIVGGNLVLHSDNGSPMKAYTMLSKLSALGIEPSFSRPRVSNDNPYSESLFKTCKYRPNFMVNGFATLKEAREWFDIFVKWYNNEHHHSGIAYLTPHQRHREDWRAILQRRKEVFDVAKQTHPERWNGRATQKCEAPNEVYLVRANK